MMVLLLDCLHRDKMCVRAAGSYGAHLRSLTWERIEMVYQSIMPYDGMSGSVRNTKCF